MAKVDPIELDPPLVAVLLQVASAFEKQRVRYALIGGVAMSLRGRPRFTEDLDFIADIPQVVLPRLLDDLEHRGYTIDQLPVIRRWIDEHLVVLHLGGVRVDWLKPVLPFYSHVIDGASRGEAAGVMLQIASAEGLILTKLLAFRTQDQADIEQMLASNRGRLDLDGIRREWNTVASADDPRMQRFDEMVQRFYRPSSNA